MPSYPLPRDEVDQERRARERQERENTRRGDRAAARARSLEMMTEQRSREYAHARDEARRMEEVLHRRLSEQEFYTTNRPLERCSAIIFRLRARAAARSPLLVFSHS